MSSVVDELERLAGLVERGFLSHEEFSQAKEKILGVETGPHDTALPLELNQTAASEPVSEEVEAESLVYRGQHVIVVDDAMAFEDLGVPKRVALGLN